MTVYVQQITKTLLQRCGVRVKQAMPGRLRVRVRSLRYAGSSCSGMEYRLAQLEGVTAVETRLATGSVIVLFDPAALGIHRILAEIIEQVPE